MRAKEFITEKINVPKNTWQFISTSNDKNELSDELIRLVNNAYKNTTLGSFIKSISDVLSSQWIVLDWDDNPDIDVCIFYRKNRNNESWIGNKVQGIGHDGRLESKKKMIDKLISFINKPGNWIEASDALRKTLLNNNAPVVTNEKLLKRIFNNELKMLDDHTYIRQVSSGLETTESVFGKPEVK